MLCNKKINCIPDVYIFRYQSWNIGFMLSYMSLGREFLSYNVTVAGSNCLLQPLANASTITTTITTIICNGGILQWHLSLMLLYYAKG